MQPKAKWKFAIGTTSRVPSSGGSHHYLIADFDTDNIMHTIDSLSKWEVNNIILQRTPHGWHLYTDNIGDFDTIIYKLVVLGADKKWIEIGRKRGYFFLADKDMIFFPWAVEHMVIKYAKKEAQNPITP